ncbi:MAG: hypothetical protein UEM33_14815 [Enterocloster sp.]|nr:hypothetical protein [Enterocloster sp.]
MKRKTDRGRMKFRAFMVCVLSFLVVTGSACFLLYRKDRLRRSFELKMPAGRRATQIDDLGIKKDKNLPH